MPGLPVGIYDYRLSGIYPIRVVNKIKKWKLDVIHSHTEFGVGTFARLISKQLNIPLVHTYHTMYEDYVHYITHGYFNKSSKKLVEYLTLFYCDTTANELIVPTKKTWDLFKDKYRLDKNIYIIPTGIEIERFYKEKIKKDSVVEVRKQLGLNNNDFVLLFVGRLGKEKNVDFNTLLRLYMYDRFVEILSKSKYRENFIIKGGFYLSTLFGVENRITMDIDTAFRNANFNEDTIVKMIKEILSIKIDDNTKLSYLGIAPIRDEDEYGGFRVDIQVELENVKEKFHVDIATGDPITPKEIRYKYIPLLGDNYIDLYAYNIETVLAEKIETILSRVELNGRMRDFYDVYLIYTKDWENVNKEHFNNALLKTFGKRDYYGNPFVAIDLIRDSELIRARWKNYQKRYEYASNIGFDEILICLEKIINVIVLETV